MASILTPHDVDRLIENCVSSLPGEPSDPLRLHQESATELLIDELAAALSARVAPDLETLEERLAADLEVEKLPPWMTRSRVVLVVRDAAQDPAFMRAMDRLPAGQRYRLYGDWGKLAASLYRDFPDEQIAGKPAVALNLLAGQSKQLRKALGQALSMELEGRQRQSWFDGLRGMVAKSQPTAPRPTTAPRRIGAPKPEAVANADGQRPSFDPEAGIRRPSGTPRLGRKTKKPNTSNNAGAKRMAPPQQQAKPQASRKPVEAQRQLPPPQAAKPVKAPAIPAAAKPKQQAQAAKAPAMPTSLASDKPQLIQPIRASQPIALQRPLPASVATRPEQEKALSVKQKKRGMRAFEAGIADQFEGRGLAPIAVTTAATAAIVMAERVQQGDAPDFYEVEYEVMARAGEAVAPGAVRTWTLHAFMECMRDDWFRELFHALPSQARAETVWVWAKAAAEWFDVPAKLREFWVRSLSGGDPVLAAAAARAFAAKAPQLPTRPTAAPLSPPPPSVVLHSQQAEPVRMPAPQPQLAAQAPTRVSDATAIGYQTTSLPAATLPTGQSQIPASAMQLIEQQASGVSVTTPAGPVEQQAAPRREMPLDSAPSLPQKGETGAPSSNASTADHQPQPTFRPPLHGAGGQGRARAALTGGMPKPMVTPKAKVEVAATPVMPTPAPVVEAPKPVPASAMSRPTVPTPPQVTAQPLIDRQTPRAEPREEANDMPAQQATAPKPASTLGQLPKRTPRVPVRSAAVTGSGALGSAEIYYGAPGSSGSPQVPGNLAQMETIGSGD